MIIYICALLCSHIAAFHVQANMRSTLMRHILTLPMGFMDSEGSGKIRKIVNESTAATETYLAHQDVYKRQGRGGEGSKRCRAGETGIGESCRLDPNAEW